MPTVERDEPSVVEIVCDCGVFRWAPSENGDTGDRPIENLEAEAVMLWNVAQGAGSAHV